MSVGMQEAGTLEDPNWRVPDQHTMDQQYMGGGFTFAVPNAEFLDFSGPGGPALESSEQPILWVKRSRNCMSKTVTGLSIVLSRWQR